MSYVNSLLLVRLFTMLAEQMMVFLVPFYVYKLTGSVAASGLAFAVEFIPRLVGVAISPNVLNRWKETSTLRVLEGLKWCVLLAYIFLLTLFTEQNTAIVFPLIAGLFGFLAELAFPVLEKHLGYVSTHISGTSKESIFSKQQSVDTVAMALGPVISALLVGFASHVQMLILFSILQFSSFALLTLAMKSNQKKLAQIELPTAQEQKASLYQGLCLIRRERRLFEAFVIGFLLNLGLGILLLSSQDYLVKRLGVAGETFGLLLSLAGISCAITLFYIDKITKKVRLKTLSTFCMLVSALILVIIGTTGSFYVYCVMFILFFISDNIFAVYIRTLRSALFDGKNLISVLGCMIVLFLLAFPCAGILAYFLGDCTVDITLPAIALLIFVTAFIFKGIKYHENRATHLS
ncbi:putative integral membrane protein [Photobacterium marinum]|uniref:Putative integral membrane protein n=1 Tax=Photobacterium marinum TaxID=1056511 RepID=L8JCN4_9GAMM|nr:MFS transporter [Photobacterium marinum]ELR66605.1 putative integral membrane protein [Photobacterium marinum]